MAVLPYSKGGKPFAKGGKPVAGDTGCACCGITGCTKCSDSDGYTITVTFAGVTLDFNTYGTTNGIDGNDNFALAGGAVLNGTYNNFNHTILPIGGGGGSSDADGDVGTKTTPTGCCFIQRVTGTGVVARFTSGATDVTFDCPGTLAMNFTTSDASHDYLAPAWLQIDLSIIGVDGATGDLKFEVCAHFDTDQGNQAFWPGERRYQGIAFYGNTLGSLSPHLCKTHSGTVNNGITSTGLQPGATGCGANGTVTQNPNDGSFCMRSPGGAGPTSQWFLVGSGGTCTVTIS